jgi:hypothetical protein
MGERLLREARAWFPLAFLHGAWDGAPRLLLVFAGSPERVAAQVDLARLGLGPGIEVLEDGAALLLLEDLSRRLVPQERLAGFGGALPTFLGGRGAATTLEGESWIADLLRGHLWWLSASAGRVPAVREALRAGEGHLHLEAPSGSEPPAEPWGADPGAERPLWEGLKRAFDPAGHLASGRLPGGV